MEDLFSSGKTLFIVDGYGQIFRSYYAFISNPLTDRQGNNVSAVFGFFNTLLTLLKKYKPTYIAVALDSKGKTFRHELYDQYKANRDKTPEDLHAQIPIIKNIMDAVGLKYYECTGVEADDIIATLAKNASQNKIESIMVTGDKDLLQLVGPNVKALRPPRKGEHKYRLCSEKDVLELFGVKPSQITDYLTILGDSSDNVPGIAGLGEKSAVKLLTDYTSLDNVYANIQQLGQSVKTKLENARDKIELSRTLIKLKDDVYDSSLINYNQMQSSELQWGKAASIFADLGSSKLQALVKTTGSATTLSSCPAANRVSETENKEENKTENKEKKTYKAPDDKFNTSLAGWMLDSNSLRYSIDDLCEKYNTSDIKSLNGVLNTLLIENNLKELYENMELPLVPILLEMQETGILLKPEKLKEFENYLEAQCSEISKSIFELCGHEFNLNSPKQLQEVLFVERELPTGKKTATGFSTDSDVLEDLALNTEDPVPALILRYRTLSKLASVYTSSLIELADKNGRVHTTFIQTGTATGRLASKNPNLQNIPVRTEEGRKIRSAFEAGEGCVLVSSDYSQIELAVLAHMSNDKALCESFIKGEDVHRQTAALIFDVLPELVTSEQRRIAKTINFGVIYGMSAFRLAGDLKIPRKDAQRFIATYFEKYSGVADFIENTKKEALQNLYVKTMMGHIRHVNEIASSNHVVKASGERIAVNTVIQGTAAEIVKLAMIAISKALKENNLKSKLILQIHDEVILEVPQTELQTVTDLVKTSMENAVKLSVPLRVAIESGKNWGDFH